MQQLWLDVEYALIVIFFFRMLSVLGSWKVDVLQDLTSYFGMSKFCSISRTKLVFLILGYCWERICFLHNFISSKWNSMGESILQLSKREHSRLRFVGFGRAIIASNSLSNFLTVSATQSQLVCSGCRNLLLYPIGASSVCCAVCNAVTAVPPPGTSSNRSATFPLIRFPVLQFV